MSDETEVLTVPLIEGLRIGLDRDPSPREVVELLAAAFEKAMDVARAVALQAAETLTGITEVFRHALGYQVPPRDRPQSPFEQACGRLHNEHIARTERLSQALLMEEA